MIPAGHTHPISTYSKLHVHVHVEHITLILATRIYTVGKATTCLQFVYELHVHEKLDTSVNVCMYTGQKKREAAIREDERLRRQKKLSVSSTYV